MRLECKDIIKIADERKEFVTDVDGYVYWWPVPRGHFASWHLRAIADELDKRNKEWHKTCLEELGDGEPID